ncbi:MAG: START domain-containing protein [Myxococcales bacterium]
MCVSARSCCSLVVVLAVASFLAARPAAAEEAWKTYLEKEGARFERRDVPGSSYPELRATKEVRQPLEKVLAAVWASVSDLTSTKDHQKRLVREGPGEIVVYQQISVAVVTDRDYTVRIWRTPPAADGTVEVRYQVANELGPPPNPKYVRLEAIRGAWTLTPLPDGGTRVSYLAFSEAGGSVPAGLARGPQRDRFASDYLGVLRALESAPSAAAPDAGSAK